MAEDDQKKSDRDRTPVPPNVRSEASDPVAQAEGRERAAITVARARNVFETVKLDDARHQRALVNNRLRICCVSSDLRIVDDPNKDGKYDLDLRLKDEGQARITVPLGDIELWKRDRDEELTVALALDPDIVAFNELAFPPCDAAGRDAVAKAMLGMLQAKQTSAFVFCGSHHTAPEGGSNVGIIFPFGAFGFQGDEDAYDPARRHIEYYKSTSMRSVGEIIASGSREFRPPAITRREGVITVLQSSDVFDFKRVHDLAERNLRETTTKMDIILVPSWATKLNEPVDAMCAYLSRWSATTVVHINANSTDSAFQPTSIFVCGEQPATFATTRRPHTLPSGRTSQLLVFDLDLNAVTEQRRVWMDSPAMKRMKTPVIIGGASLL
ncbi:MAG: hypothetical protein WAU68_11745 [Vitreimonas sp.]